MSLHNVGGEEQIHGLDRQTQVSISSKFTERRSISPPETMAEGILFNVVGEIMNKLVRAQAAKELGRLWGVHDEFTKLTNSVSAIRAVLLDAEERQTKSHSVKNWLEKLKEAFYDADDVLDELSSEALRREVMTRDKKAKVVSIFFSKSNQLAFDLKMAHKIKNLRERLDAIAADRSKFQFTENRDQKSKHVSFDQIRDRGDTYSFIIEDEVIGRDDAKKAVKDVLLDMNVKDNVSFVAIVGMGGIGKTTLAKSLYNDKEVSESFELKMWVWVSELFDIKIIVEKIIESATSSRPNVRELESLQSQLQKVIRGKKYLLVMDDIWNESEEKWFNLKILLMGGARGSKIVITKRDSKLSAEIANMTFLFRLKGLSERNSWQLFRKVAFKEGKEPENPNLIQLGKEILVKCRGVPLVIRNIGRLLYFKTSEEEWMFFKNNELLEVIQQENDMTSILKLSYNHLPPNLKQCFAYSSLFPEDKPICKDELIRQWMAQGFVQSLNGSKSMEDIGNDYFMELCWRLFYENAGGHISGDVYIYMHGVMHDLARMVAGNEYVCGNFKSNSVVEKTRHASFDHEIKEWWDLLPKLRKAEGLRTFLLPLNPYDKKNEINEVVLDEIFSSFPRLRVLDLKRSSIKIVPDSIRKLRHLRYLDLSGNEDMELLPNSITELQNLQTLNLGGCFDLKELPRDTSNLVNLRHLEISDSICLTHMPEGMGKLTCLQTLNLFVLDSNRHGSKLSELNGLNDLRGWLHIRGLEQLRSTPSEASLANLKGKKGLCDLILQWKPSWNKYKAQPRRHLIDEIVLEDLEPHPNVESLSILGYSGVGLPNWVSSPLSKLTYIVIVKCDRLQHLPQFNHLPALKFLALKGIRPLKFIDKNDPYSSSVFFPSLEDLCLENMPNLEGWWEWESTVGETEKHHLLPTFLRLTSLSISNCPKLASMPGHLPLKQVRVDGVGLQMMSTIGPARTSDTYSTFSSLETLELTGIEDLEYLPRKLLQDLVSLKCLSMKDCDNFVTSLSVGDHKELAALSKEEEDAMQWKLLQNIDSLIFESLPKLVSLPIGIQHWTALRRLCISNCSSFRSLPEWIGQLVSLWELEIIKCPKLKSLPEGMRQLKTMHLLRIAGCPELEERCKEGGEDWPKIAHVPHFSQFLFFFERDEDTIDTNTPQTSPAGMGGRLPSTFAVGDYPISEVENHYFFVETLLPSQILFGQFLQVQERDEEA